MQFDVIIGNPPYQMADGGGEGSSAIPLYHQFVEQAKKLEPKQVVMVIPARWYSGGKGLDEFRDDMLTDGKLAEIHDFQETSLVFPNVNIRGGICFFRWSQSHSGATKVTNYSKDHPPTVLNRQVLESGISTFVRYNEAISILKKVRKFNEETYSNRVQSRNPYGIPSNFEIKKIQLFYLGVAEVLQQIKLFMFRKIKLSLIRTIKTKLKFLYPRLVQEEMSTHILYSLLH
jgi:site-specific DNA-methyltransferase (adenine-specific)